MSIIINGILICLNVIVITAGYFIIKNRIEKKLVRKELIEEIKKEINSLMISFNETTHHNITLLEDKINKINKIITLADKKMHGLESFIGKISAQKDDLSMKEQKITYSPQKIINQSKKQAEIIMNNQNQNDLEDENELVLQELEGLTIIEKIKALAVKGKSREEARKILKLDRGEFDLLINFEDINFEG